MRYHQLLFVLVAAIALTCAGCHHNKDAISSAGVGESGGGLGRTGAGSCGGSSSSGNMDRSGGGNQPTFSGTGGTDSRTHSARSSDQ